MHWCANVVCGPEGQASALLIRALSPLRGLDEMRRVRVAARRDRDLCNGPAKLCQALGISGDDNGTDLLAPLGRGKKSVGVRLVDDGTPPPQTPAQGRRIGIRVATDK